MQVVIIDNYDSFTYNLKHYIEPYVNRVDVVRNDRFRMEDLADYDAIAISPGPGLPNDSGHIIELVSVYASSKKILGICLGHQAIAMAFGARLKNLNTVLHGVSLPTIAETGSEAVFQGLPIKFDCARYHSWIIDPEGFPRELEITSRDMDGNIMSIRHKKYDVHGFQFHPESILTEYGMQMIKNWLSL